MLINLALSQDTFEAIPNLVKDYRIEMMESGNWKTLVEYRDNHKRKHVHALAETVTADRIRVVVESTNGSPYAEIIEVRVYA